MKLSSAQISFYEKNGYVIVAAAFSAKIIDEIAEEAQEFSVKEEGETFVDFRGTSIVLQRNSKLEPVIKRVVWAGACQPRLLELGRSQTILGPVKQLLKSKVGDEPEEADHLINQIHDKHSGDEVFFPVHQDEQNRRRFDPDWEDINGRGSFVQSLIAVDDCTLENGPLYVYPRSHQYGYLHLEQISKAEELPSILAKKGIADASWQATPLLMRSGDIAFMHSHLIHQSAPTKKNRRRVFINGFSYPGANHRPYPGVGSAKRISLVGPPGLEPGTKGL